MMKNNTMLHRSVAILLSLLLLMMSLGGCGAVSDSGSTDDSKENTEDAGQLSQVIPWGKDGAITQQAMDSKSVIICFMSGEGTKIKSDSDTAFAESKWGDSALIAFPNGQTMLIDGAMQDYAPLLVENLRSLGIARLDYVVVSHRHNDHIGGLTCKDGVLNSFEIGQIYSSGI